MTFTITDIVCFIYISKETHFLLMIRAFSPFFLSFICRSHERTQEELELVFEELLHIAALSHLSTSIKRELASIIVFEAHAHAGTIRKCFTINQELRLKTSQKKKKKIKRI